MRRSSGRSSCWRSVVRERGVPRGVERRAVVEQLAHRHPPVEVLVLRDVADLLELRGPEAPRVHAEHAGAARRRPQDVHHRLDRRRLAGAVRPDEREDACPPARRATGRGRPRCGRSGGERLTVSMIGVIGSDLGQRRVTRRCLRARPAVPTGPGRRRGPPGARARACGPRRPGARFPRGAARAAGRAWRRARARRRCRFPGRTSSRPSPTRRGDDLVRGVRVDAQLLAECADRRERVAGPQLAGDAGLLDGEDHLFVHRQPRLESRY